jgi:hypothetical protein
MGGEKKKVRSAIPVLLPLPKPHVPRFPHVSQKKREDGRNPFCYAAA